MHLGSELLQTSKLRAKKNLDDLGKQATTSGKTEAQGFQQSSQDVKHRPECLRPMSGRGNKRLIPA